MNRTRIEWCDRTWNPVTGCKHGCPYCYAAKMVKRFAGKNYRNDFQPDFHAYRLDEPQRIKKPQNIFVCSMADLFGDWVPDEWIKQVFDACEQAPQHRYIFLTKNPRRYLYTLNVALEGYNLDNCYFGSTITNESDKYFYSDKHNAFVSIEPLQSSFENGSLRLIKWVIIGAETGNRKGKIIPEKKWIENITERCKGQNIPMFLKNSLAPICGEPLIQEYPWENGVKNGK